MDDTKTRQKTKVEQAKPVMLVEFDMCLNLKLNAQFEEAKM